MKPTTSSLPELTLRGMTLGALLTVVFTASNVYLGLKVGLTFSSAIPAAVISMVVLRFLGNGNILENNLVQTQASAAGTVSAVIFILPGLVMMGHWQGFPYWETLGICAVGGMLGVIFTIPLRRVMVVESDLPYPEGVAAAEVLRVGSAGKEGEEETRRGLRDILFGGLIAGAISFGTNGLRILSESVNLWMSAGAAIFRLPLGFSYALLGAGYLVGIVAGIATLVGLVIAWGIAVPILTSEAVRPEGVGIASFATEIWSTQVRFLGAGTLGIAAVWTLATLFKPMVTGIRTSLVAMRGQRAQSIERTERDLSPGWIIALSLLLIVALGVVFAVFLSDVPVTIGQFWGLVLYGTVFAFVFGFLVAAACGYMAGLVGSSSSPISGIGIVAVILVSLLLLLSGMMDTLLETEHGSQLAIAVALFVTSAVIAIAAIANDNLQDLKAGYLVGATPWKQQVALLIGCVVGALVIAPVLTFLYQGYGFSGALPRPDMNPAYALSAPQATLMTAIATGIFTHNLNWEMINIGIALGIVLIGVDQLLRIRGKGARLPVLAVGIGIYLPPQVSTMLVIGAIFGWLIQRALARRALREGKDAVAYAERPQRRAVLIASGLIVGESLVGVTIAALIGITGNDAPLALLSGDNTTLTSILSVIVLVLVLWAYARRIMQRDSQ